MWNQETRYTLLSSLSGALVDAAAVWGGFWVAFWIRFDSGWMWVDPFKGIPSGGEQDRQAALAVAVFLVTFRALELYRRPHVGRFEDKIPRLVRAIGLSFIFYFALTSIMRLEPSVSRKAMVVAAFTVTFLIILFRYFCYRVEWNLARHMDKINRVLILGSDAVALRLKNEVLHEPFLRSEIMGFLQTGEEAWPDAIPETERRGNLDQLETLLTDLDINQVILCDDGLPRKRMVDIVMFCEEKYISFYLVPDLFRILTSGVDLQNIGGVLVMGFPKWPLDYFHHRMIKRLCDIASAALGLLLTGPLILAAGIAVKRGSKGPMFFRQERLGRSGTPFTIYKLRTMRVDPEAESKPGWTVENDPRRTRLGSFLRRTNIDELPQLWNVLKGDMSLVGPRPEQPFFAEQFKEDIERYMKRHIHKPGITGWAQVNGLRGDTSISDRLRYDLFYLENWSLGLDFKILVKTVFSHENAY